MQIEPIFPFKHKEILQSALPLGGIGTGCISFNGYGGLQNFAIRNRPYFSVIQPMKDMGANGSIDMGAAFLHITGIKSVSRLIEGPYPVEKIFTQGLGSGGVYECGNEGFPRFRNSTFESGYPFGRVNLTDPRVPLRVQVTAWNPFIPLDDVASGMPVAILEYRFKNPTRKSVSAKFTYYLTHLAQGLMDKKRDNKRWQVTRNEVIPGKGVHFTNILPSQDESFGSAALTLIGRKPKIKAMWLRGEWFDAASAMWKEVETGKFVPNDGQEDVGHHGRNGGAVQVEFSLNSGEELTLPVVISWYFPNSYLQAGSLTRQEVPEAPCWKTYYSTLWRDAREVAAYVERNYKTLRQRTVSFQRDLLESTLPVEALDAISANLGILKSPTVLRLVDGQLWGWEGSSFDGGLCHGSCTHVWNYAQAFPHLFPKLERTLRELEWKHSMDERGHVDFRAALPVGLTAHTYHSASDGQAGGIMKLYRDWQISGDTEWMRELYPDAKKSLNFCIETWDPNRQGVLVEPHHNTYDIEFWGADGMCSTIYIGALSAMALMAQALGEESDRQYYQGLAQKGAAYLERQLFNGDYFEQRVQYKGLKETSFADLVEGDRGQMSREAFAILKKEGPKYQYGKGCLSDGVIGAWMAKIYGIEIPLNRDKVRKNLKSIFKHNFKKDLFEYPNSQRAGYAMGHEKGLLLCTWPNGGKPTLPFVYSDEVWTGIEYQVASHLIEEGMVKEGLEIVKGVRSRYEGRIRNPWCEYEWGGYYARAMASFALLGSLSGFRYSAVEKTLHFGPKISEGRFKSFFVTSTAFGSISLNKKSLVIEVREGSLEIKKLHLTIGNKPVEIPVNVQARHGKPVEISIRNK